MVRLSWLGSTVGFVGAMGIVTGACGSGSSSGASGDVGPFVDQVADVLCAVASNCCVGAGHTVPVDCVTNARTQLHGDIDRKSSATTRLNREAADQCLAGYRDISLTCPTVWDPNLL